MSAQPGTLPMPFDDEFYADPYRAYAKLNDTAPIHRISTPSGAAVWLLTGYDEVRDGLKDKRLARHQSHAGPDYQQDVIPGPMRVGNLMTEDQPEHTRLRKFMNFAFLPKRVEALRPRMREVVEASLDELERNGKGDLMSILAAPLPITMISAILGVPEEDREDFRGWVDGLFGGTPDSARDAGIAMVTYLTGLVGRKRGEPDDGLISYWITGGEDGGDGTGGTGGSAEGGMTDQEIIGMAFVLLFGGYDTTFGMIGAGALALLSRPEVLDRVRNDPDSMSRVVEELLRYYGTAHTGVRRFATEDLTIGGVTVPKGDTVLLSIAAANRDARHFADPDILDVDRSNLSHHVAFGRGPHHCPGSELSRMEIEIALDALIRRFPDLKLAVAPESVQWRPSFIFRVPLALPVVV